MDLLGVGSANQYAKNMARRTQWKLKKQSGDFAGHKKSLGDYVNVTKALSVLPQTDEADRKMSAIMTKAQAGKKISPDEWDYLKTKNPVMYEKLKAVEKEQKDYEEALKRCKTRDEAQRLHVSKLGEVMSEAKNGDEGALFRLNRLTRTMVEFTKSDDYREMPTESEEAIERESERQAERDALREEAQAKEAEKESVRDEREAAQDESVPKDNGPDAATESKADAVTVPHKNAAKVKADGVSKDAQAVGNPPRAQIGDASAHGAAPFGQRAYLLRQNAQPLRRKAVDAQA